jgi:L-methionine (R)-S-oxide reductase
MSDRQVFIVSCEFETDSTQRTEPGSPYRVGPGESEAIAYRPNRTRESMVETLMLPEGGGKEKTYAALLPQIEAVISGTDDLIANLANVAAILKQAFAFHWVGFYRVVKPETLVLGPFQGPLACVEIPFAKGVCGKAATDQRTQLVPDVDSFPGHIACSSLSKSEIVVPLVYQGETKLVLDVDSDRLADFDATDQRYLEQIINLIRLQNFSDRPPQHQLSPFSQATKQH